jgi:hypothetical protein
MSRMQWDTTEAKLRFSDAHVTMINNHYAA